MQSKYNKIIAKWLFVCCIMIAVMVLIGGLTRLTESGLSMTNWKPITGWFPPLSEEQWLDEFASYKKSPEFIKINSYMQLEDFKEIFWLEYIHRVAGRLTGLVFLLPLLFFALKGWLDRDSIVKLSGIFALGALQAVIGWLMVSSGLKDAPHVSQYWLAFHLLSAFLIFSLTLLMALNLQFGDDHFSFEASEKYLPEIKFLSILFLVCLTLQIFMGALVAGLHAGKIYNTYPLMDGKFLPDSYNALSPFYMNMLDNIALVQFNHRHFAIFVGLVGLSLLMLIIKSNLPKKIKNISKIFFGIILLQIILGVKTLLLAVPVWSGSMHQMIALLLLSVTVYLIYALFSRRIG